MEVNTVTISLERFKQLEKAEIKLEEPRSKTIIIKEYFGYPLRVETDSDSVALLAVKLKKSEANLIELKKLKGITFWQLLKTKLKN